MSTPLLTNQQARFSVGAADDANNAKPAGFSAQVSGYPNAYVYLNGANEVNFVARQPGNFTVTVTGHSQNGTLLPTLTVDFVVSAPPVPQATHLTATDPIVRNQDITTAADPGTDTITGNV